MSFRFYQTHARAGLAILLLTVSPLAVSSAFAADITWNGNTDTNYATGTNWSGGAVPGSGDTAIFTNSFTNGPTINLGGFTTPDTWQFASGAPAYTFSVPAFGILQFEDGGIIDNSAHAPTIQLTNFDGLSFENSASAGDAIITNGLGTSGVSLIFDNSSTAANSTINIDSAFVQFDETSTAGNATINATGTDVSFNDNADAGTAAISATQNSNVDFTRTSGPGGLDKISVGSLAGDGTVFLGSNTVSVGGNNQSTTFSGVISDDCGSGGECQPAPGGVLVKVGTGTFTLTGSNTYTGGTAIDAGTLNIGADDNLGAAGTALSFGGGTLQYGAAFALDASRTITLNAGGGAIDTNGFDATIGSSITGTGGFTKAGNGTLILNGTVNYSGATTVSGGVLQFGDGTSGDFALEGAIVDNSGLVFDPASNVTVSGNISGSGYVNLASGNLTLSGSNTYSGGTQLNPNTAITVSSPSNLGSGAIIFGAGSTIHFTAGGTFSQAATFDTAAPIIDTAGHAVTWSGLISGPGDLEATGGGTLTLTDSANTYSGGTEVIGNTVLNIASDGALGATATGLALGDATTGGTLQLGSSFNLSSARIIAVNAGGGTFDTNGFDTTVTQAIAGAGGLTKAGAGTLTLTGSNTYTGGTTISTGTLRLGDGGTTGMVTGNIVDNGALAFDRSGDLTYADKISGTGTLEQAGTGTLTLTGINTYTGATTVASGTLSVNGSIASSAVTVNSNATLSGTGTVGATHINSGGKLTPAGNAIGTIHVSGDFALASTAIQEVQLSPTAADKTLVTGTASVAGDLVAEFQTGSYSAGTKYTLINSTGALSGTFTSLNITGVPTGLQASVTYDNHDVFLSLLPAINPNEGEIYASMQTAFIEDERLIRNGVLNNLFAAGDGIRVWGEGFAAYGTIDGNGGAADLKHNHGGGIAGIDASLGDGFRAGLAGAYTAYKMSVPERTSEATGTSGHVVAYAGWANEALALRAGVDLGWSSSAILRRVASVSETDRSHENGHTTQIFADAGYIARFDGGTFEPHAQLVWTDASSGAFQETGGPVSELSGSRNSGSATFGSIGIRGRLNSMAWGTVLITPTLDIGWQHAFDVATPDRVVTLDSTGTATRIFGVASSRDTATAQLGANVAFTPNLDLWLGYDGIRSARQKDDAIIAQLRWAL